MVLGELIDWLIQFSLISEIEKVDIAILEEDGERAVKVFHSADAAGVGSNEVNRSIKSE
jgi:hypothetical protein